MTTEGIIKSLQGGPQRQLLLLSILALFSELLIIRWLSTEIRIFAYFKNLPLMSAFLGLGLGFIWTNNKRDVFSFSQMAFFYLAGLLMVALPLGLTYLSFIDPDQFMVWGTSIASNNEHLSLFWLSLRNLAILLGVFVLSATTFVGLGQRMGKLFGVLNSLEAYSINILGGLLGIILFSVLSYLRTSPGIWLICAGLLYIAIEKRAVAIGIVVLGLAYSLGLGTAMAHKTYGDDYVKTVWSPYYRIDVIRYRQNGGPFKGSQLGYNIYINYDSFQSILDCSPAALQKFPKSIQQTFFDERGGPFRLLDKPGNVLILGGGTGSDIAAALRANQSHVDAVEIDPCIVKLGQEMHPEKPYAAPNVTAYVTDARNFLKHCKKKYDLIIFAALDSHAAFSSVSSLRMDNYVFTQEALNEAANCLTPNGIIYNQFVIPGEWLWDRHCKTLAAATRSVVYGYHIYADQLSGGIFAGPGVSPSKLSVLPEMMKRAEVNLNSPVPVSTDDWPFLFLPKKQLSSLYALPVLSILLIALLPVATQFISGARLLLNWQMLTLGMGFMLLEVFAMSKLSLLCGSTWTVNSIVISGVMVMVLFANWLASKLGKQHIRYLLAALLVLVIIAKSVNPSHLGQLGTEMGILAGTIIYLLPMFFAATIFALLFKNLQSSSTALAFNLIGGVIGVCLEYLSMPLGISNLGWVAFGIYTCLFIMTYAYKGQSQS